MNSQLQEAFTEKVTHEYEQNRSNKFEVESGFYTDQMMQDDLKFTRPLYNACALLHVHSCQAAPPLDSKVLPSAQEQGNTCNARALAVVTIHAC